MNFEIIAAGIGGQGVLFLTRILCEVALKKKEHVIASEVHGMSQRGGSVTSHVKIGNFRGPLIKPGNADLLLALDWKEGLRNLHMLKRGGRAVFNAPFKFKIPATEIYSIDATESARRLGDIQLANLVILGYALSLNVLPFRSDEVRDVVHMLLPISKKELGLKALEAGFEGVIITPERRISYKTLKEILKGGVT